MLENLFRNMGPVTKNLLLINIVVFVAQFAFPWFNEFGALYYVDSEYFMPFQLVSHFFMHSTQFFGHIFFNMFALVMFGSHLERSLGSGRFLLFYFASAFGAMALHQFVMGVELYMEYGSFFVDFIYEKVEGGVKYLSPDGNWDPFYKLAAANYGVGMLGASGAVFGILAGFAYLFPDVKLQLLIPPIPIKAKYFVLIYGAIELYLGFANNPGDSVAHFAHIGGALIGFLLVYFWNRNRYRMN